jgi:membrane fusion protein (multidrug efflux system)
MKRKVSAIMALIVGLTALTLPACNSTQAEEHESGHEAQNKILVTSPETKDVIITQPYVCQIHAQKHIEVKALEEGYLEEIHVKEGQAVKKGDVLFRVVPAIYKAKWETEKAEVNFAEVKLNNTKKLAEQKIVSDQQVKLDQAELNKAIAKMNQAAAELGFTNVTARFDGIIDRLYQQQGSLVGKGDLLTTLSDTSVMWVYFNVPEARYFEFKRREGKSEDKSRLKLIDAQIELRLADGSIFKHQPEHGNVVTVEGKFNNETGNIAFRADFRNPEGLLRHGQTGTILIHRKMPGALVIPQRATFEVLDKQYVWVVDENHTVHRRMITIENELEDIYVIKSGLELKDKFILDGVRQVHEGEKVEYEFEKPDAALKNQKHHAE